MTRILSPQEQFLTDFHNQNAGITTHAYQSLHATVGTRRYASTYECLASAVPASDQPRTVLDLACGDGFLLSLLAGHQQARQTLVGIDMSQGELAAARNRLDACITLYFGKAQSLPLSSASVDCVLCHMALMLMDKLDDVLSEVHRVLKDGACFAFVIGAQPTAGAAFDRYLSRLRDARQSNPSAALSLGDPRLRNPDGIREALTPRFGDIAIEDIVLRRRYTPAQLWQWFEDMYDLHFMPPAQRQRFRDEYLAELDTLRDEDDRLEFTDMLRMVTCTSAN